MYGARVLAQLERKPRLSINPSLNGGVAMISWLSQRSIGTIGPLVVSSLATGAFALVPACDPYQNHDGEFFAGAVDPAKFPGPYLGALPGSAGMGGGEIAPVPASVKGQPVFYFQFPAD